MKRLRATALLCAIGWTLASGCAAVYPYSASDSAGDAAPNDASRADLPAPDRGPSPPGDAQPPAADTQPPRDAPPPPPDAPPPPGDTQPPPADTQPPPADTQPPPADAPPPPADTQPPPVDTQPPPVDTQPPPVDTQPPPVDTQPPPVDTQPPPDALDCPSLSALYASTLDEAKACTNDADCTAIVPSSPTECCTVYANNSAVAQLDLLAALVEQFNKLVCTGPCPVCVFYSHATCDGMGMNKTCVDQP